MLLTLLNILLIVPLTSPRHPRNRAGSCYKKSVQEICSNPTDCPGQYQRLSNNNICESLTSPTPSTDPLSTQLLTFPYISTESSWSLVSPNNVGSLGRQYSCQGVVCPSPLVCSTATATCTCPNFCANQRTAYSVTCGSDCKNYFSWCHFENARCRSHYAISDTFPVTGELFTYRLQGYCPPRRGPTVQITPGHVVVYQGGTATLICQVLSSQTPTVTWQREGGDDDQQGVPSNQDVPEEVDTVQSLHDQQHVQVHLGEQITYREAISDDVTNTTLVLILQDMQFGSGGRYVCSAVMCDSKYSSSQTAHLQVLPALRSTTCSVLSAGFIRTFDGLTYQANMEGDYILAMDIVSYKWFIYGRFKTCRGSDNSRCLVSVTVYDIRSGLSLYPDMHVLGRGIWRRLAAGEVLSRDYKSAELVGETTLMTIYDRTVMVAWDNTMSAYLTISPGMRTGGLCGNNDKIQANEFLPRYRRNMGNFEAFIASWRVTKSYSPETPASANVPHTDAVSDQWRDYCQGLVEGTLGTCQLRDVEVLVRVCGSEMVWGSDAPVRAGCGLECYIAQQVDIMCNTILVEI